MKTENPTSAFLDVLPTEFLQLRPVEHIVILYQQQLEVLS